MAMLASLNITDASDRPTMFGYWNDAYMVRWFWGFASLTLAVTSVPCPREYLRRGVYFHFSVRFSNHEVLTLIYRLTTYVNVRWPLPASHVRASI